MAILIIIAVGTEYYVAGPMVRVLLVYKSLPKTHIRFSCSSLRSVGHNYKIYTMTNSDEFSLGGYLQQLRLI